MPENASGKADSGNTPRFKSAPDSTYERLYVNYNFSSKDIADHFDTSRDKIRTQLLSRGILREKEIKVSKEKLKELYHEQGLSQSQVADKIGISKSSVYRHINHYELKKGPKQWQRDRYGNSVSFRTNKRGYEVLSIPGGGEYAVHRLVAVAEHGVEAVSNNDVHHMNGIKWDNRPGNLRPMPADLHASIHNAEGDGLSTIIEKCSESKIRTALRENGYVEAADKI